MSAESDYLTPEILEKDIQGALKRGFIVVRSTPKTLLCDLDSGAAEDQFWDNINQVDRFHQIIRIESWKSKSGKKHIHVELEEGLEVPERLILQLMLGSDPMRELLGLQRYRNGCNEPSLLFKPKDNAVIDETYKI
jgi:hypothetical protein